MKTPQLLNYCRDQWLAGDGGLTDLSSAIDGSLSSSHPVARNFEFKML